MIPPTFHEVRQLMFQCVLQYLKHYR